MAGQPGELYALAQMAMAQLKAAVYGTLYHGPSSGLTNSEIGRTLGIYGGHVGHVGHISRVILAHLEEEGVAAQDPDSKKWFLIRQSGSTDETPRPSSMRRVAPSAASRIAPNP